MSARPMSTAWRLICVAMLCAGAGICHAQLHGAELKTIAILEFDLIDDQRELSPATVEYQRLITIHDQLQEESAKTRLYRVTDVGPAAAPIKMYQSRSQPHESH